MNNKTTLRNLFLLILVFLLTMSGSAQDPGQPDGGQLDAPSIYSISDNGTVFVHVATGGNISFNQTIIDHPLLNGNPKAILFVTPLWQSGDPTTNDYIGVWYNGSQWTIYNQGALGESMTANRRFIVQALSPSESVFQAQAPDPSNNIYFELDHPLLNGNPLAQLQITPTWTVDGQDTGVYYDAPHVVEYFDESTERWVIGNPEFVNMPANAGFNVQILTSSSRNITFVHVATEANYLTILDHPLLNNNPNAKIHAVGVLQPFDVSGGFVPSLVTVYYNAVENDWRIYREDFANIPVNSRFFVTILKTFDPVDNAVINGGFEVGAPDDLGKPAGWKAVNLAKRNCNKVSRGKFVAYEQYCAAQIPGGNGINNGLNQTISDISQFTSGSSVYIGGRITGRNVSPGARMLAVLKLVDGTKAKVKVAAADLQGTYAYKPVQGVTAATLANDANNVTIKLLHRGSGKLFADAVYLSTSNFDDVYSASEINPLPLPAAAD